MTEDAQFEALCNVHREKIVTLFTAGVFDVADGQVVININGGVFVNIYANRRMYQRTKKVMIFPLLTRNVNGL